MSSMGRPTCTGCKRTDKQIGGYGKNNPVEEDGSYSNGKFVCDSCYCILINRGQDIGTPEQLQKCASELKAVEAFGNEK